LFYRNLSEVIKFQRYVHNLMPLLRMFSRHLARVKVPMPISRVEALPIIYLLDLGIPMRQIGLEFNFLGKYTALKLAPRLQQVLTETLQSDELLSSFILYKGNKFICLLCGWEEENYELAIEHVRGHVIRCLERYEVELYGRTAKPK